MFGTIIADAYKFDEIEVIAGYIDELCSPMDTVGWASAGIYSFWNYDTKEILYIGLASDLYTRFRQHNGLLPIDTAACKYLQIQRHFECHEKLGYTIMTQSPLFQPIVYRNEKKYRKFLDKPKGSPIEDYAGEEGIEHIRKAEGQLLEAYRLVKGNLPLWNKVGGDRDARKMSTVNNYLQIIRAFSVSDENNFLVSKSTIRELAQNSKYEWFEVNLHALRTMMLTMGVSYQDALEFHLILTPSYRSMFDFIEKENYLMKRLII